MRGALRFALILVCGLGLLAWVALAVVQSTTREWFQRDLKLRAQLAVSGPARQALISRWDFKHEAELISLLEDITRDERILAASACSDGLQPLARTSQFPEELDCAALGAGMRPATDTGEWTPRHETLALSGREIHMSALPISDGQRVLGLVALVHDLTFVERRESTARQFMLIAFGILAFAASALTVIAARIARRGWLTELRSILKNGEPRAEFQPIMRDVRELVDRLVAEKETDEGGAWTPQRLKLTLNRHLQGEKVVVIANREPYVHDKKPDGTIGVLHPASGLVTALEPVMRACSGTWIAHGSGSGDRATVDDKDRVKVPPGEESYSIRRVWLSREEEQGYYYGFSNEGLWPLCHLAHTRPTFRSEDWAQYQAVNKKFADALVEEVDSEDPIVLVQDYHFALAPRLIRERLPRATVIMFWHIPWPNPQHFGICPWRKELLEGMLGASILGFHTQSDCNSFIDSVDRFLEARIDREQNAVVQHAQRTLVRPYPISLEWPTRWLKGLPAPHDARKQIFAELKLAPDALLGVGVDRLDYTKGVEERLLAVERLLEKYPQYRGRFTFVQLAAPSRTVIPRYQQLNDSVERIAERVNSRFGKLDYRPVILLRSHHEPPTVFRYYRAADFCYVSSLHDGMNLVAKEFVAAREDEGGVLLLSQFTGAARELTEALVVNPYDLDEATQAMAAALSMSRDEQRDRMRAMRSFVSEFNVYRWAGRMLVDASRLRSRERLTGRLAGHLALASGEVA